MQQGPYKNGRRALLVRGYYKLNDFFLLFLLLFSEVSVEGSEDIWFINFYSPFCSHCHDLAPTVRYEFLMFLEVYKLFTCIFDLLHSVHG